MNISAKNIRFIFGLKLRELRVQNSYSLAMLSEKTGISKSYLNEIEKGKKYPKTEKIAVLADVFEVSYDHLVSLKLDKKLSPISYLLHTNFLNDLPLDFLGIDARDLLEVLSVAPAKFSAFVDSIVQIGRHYDISVEQFYFTVLRSYQEMHDNYFVDLEALAKQYRKVLDIDPHNNDITEKLITELKDNYDYEVIEKTFNDIPELNELRYLFSSSKHPKLSINSSLNSNQKLFVLAREVAYNRMGITLRPQTSIWVGTPTFEHVLNNFKSYYFASALLLDERIFIKGLVDFTKLKSFDCSRVIDLMELNHCNAEMFMLRITNLVPHYFRFPQLFFSRYNHSIKTDVFELTKSLHGSGLDKSADAIMEYKACQRWVALITLKELNIQQKSDTYKRPICTVYKVSYENKNREYLIISVANPMTPSDNKNCCISVGFLINERFLNKTNFVNDTSIKNHTISFDWLESNSNRVFDGIRDPMVIKQDQKRRETRDKVYELL